MGRDYHPTFVSQRRPEEDVARAVPGFLRGSVMYQLFLRMMTPQGTFRAAEALVPHLAELGVDIVYLCPFTLADDDGDERYWSARQEASGLGNPCNPYRQKDFFAIDPEYGTAEELRSLVSCLHAAGMRVLFDLVYFHCGPQAVFLSEHPEYVRREADGSLRLGGWRFPELNLDLPEVREYLYGNMAYLVREFGADGFRCDVGDMLPIDFWEEAYRRLRTLVPEGIMMCEGLRGDDQHEAFDLSYGFYTQWAIKDILLGQAGASELRRAQEKELVDYPRGFHWMRCYDNHDFAMDTTMSGGRYETRADGRLCDAMLAVVFMLNGLPMLYNGQEVADDAPHSIYANRHHGRLSVDWSRALTRRGRERLALTRHLISLRHAHPGLFEAPVVWHDVSEPEALLMLSRTLVAGSLTLVVNVTEQPHRIALPAAAEHGRVLVAAADVQLEGRECVLPAYGFAIVE